MTVSSVTSTAAATTAASAAKTTAASATLNYNEFLQLLMTEMKNQDPTQPMDPAAQLSQLASFSAVEQQVQTNATLTTLLNTSGLAQAESAVGRTVTSADGSVSGVISSVTINSSGSTATLTNGKTVTLGSGVTIS
jgi:flagellar basal-body rod modification protein FlgD